MLVVSILWFFDKNKRFMHLIFVTEDTKKLVLSKKGAEWADGGKTNKVYCLPCKNNKDGVFCLK